MVNYQNFQFCQYAKKFLQHINKNLHFVILISKSKEPTWSFLQQIWFTIKGAQFYIVQKYRPT